MYTDDELDEIDKRLKKASQSYIDQERIFWEEEYPLKSKEDRIKHWSSNLFRSMRSQEEVGQNAYAIYKEAWLIEVLKVEPNFMNFLADILNIWSGMWDAERIERRIKFLHKKINNT